VKKKLLSLIFFTTLVNSTTLEDIEAMNKLAISYLKGVGVNKDIPYAHKLLLKASSKGSIEATYNLAKLYSSKKTKYYDTIKSYNLLVDNVERNHAKSQTMIAKYFLFGIAVPKDYEKSLYYFKKASKQKEFNANCYIAYIYANAKGVYPNFGRAHVFAKDEYKKGNKVCKKVWKDYNLAKYPKDKGWKFGDYNEPIR
jgi:TPR repeat protein